MSKLEEFLWFLFIIIFSAVIAWLALNPFANFLSNHIKAVETYKSKPAPVKLIPAPVKNLPCDETGCELPEQVI